MKDINILSYVARSVWAITEDKWAEMMPALIRHARGESLKAEELAAFAGNDQPTSTTRGSVAVIPIRGVIAHRMNALEDSSGGTSCEAIGRMLDAVKADSSIGTILYDFDTPGGTVPGVQELAAKMFALRGDKKQIALVNGLCASAGYWLASQCDEIVSIPSGTIGSVGVFSVHQDLSAALEKIGVDVTIIKAGKFKTEGNPFEPLTDEAKAFMQSRVDDAYAQFVKDVARGRGVGVADVRNGYGEGRALLAKEAKAAGLIDRIATMDETLTRLVGKSSAKTGMRAEDVGDLSASADPKDATAPRFAVGDRVVALVEHKKGMKGMAGAVNEAHSGAPPYYAIDFDDPMGENPHKWLNEEELKAEEAADDKSAAARMAASAELRDRIATFDDAMVAGDTDRVKDILENGTGTGTPKGFMSASADETHEQDNGELADRLRKYA